MKPGTTPDDWIVLKQLHMTAERWIQQWHKTVTKEFRSFPAGGYFVELKVPSLVHYSFSDEVYLQAAKDGAKDAEEEALRHMRLTEDITRAFLDETLRDEKQSTLHNSQSMVAKHFPPSN